ncbi:LytR/AlgR family response regulator transcription factor [Parabacteroides sp. APC149_11_2_Y6]
MEIKCIITDDEPIARKGLKRYIGKIDYLTVIGECEDAIQLNTMLQSVQPDLLFLDIEMPHLTGLEFLASLRNPPKVIITSAHKEYALQGFELDVVDYLLKPIPFQRFLKAVNKVHALMEGELPEKEKEDEYIFVKSEKQLKKIYLKEILYVESMENYIIIHTLSSKEIVNTRLKSVLASLPEKYFLQVHRSYVVNLSQIKAIEGNQLLIAGDKIPVTRTLREQVYKAIINNRLISK